MERKKAAAMLERSDFAVGRHFFNMTQIPGESDFIEVADRIERIQGYRVEKGSATYVRININSRTTQEDIMAGLRSVAILSDKVTAEKGLRKETPGNWVWRMAPDSGEAAAYVGLQCLNAAGAVDKNKNPSHGCGCRIHDGILREKADAGHDGTVALKARLSVHCVPADTDCAALRFEQLERYGCGDDPAMHASGGWIIWIAVGRPEMMTSVYGPAGFSHSGMYHRGPGDSDADYEYMMIAAVRVLPDGAPGTGS